MVIIVNQKNPNVQKHQHRGKMTILDLDNQYDGIDDIRFEGIINLIGALLRLTAQDI